MTRRDHTERSSSIIMQNVEKVKVLDAGGDSMTLLKFTGVKQFLNTTLEDTSFAGIRNLALRDDDVILCAYPRSGTHWTWEQIRMLISGKPVIEAADKDTYMFIRNSHGELDRQPSPRNAVEQLHKLSRFLGKDHDVNFLRAVSDACAIEKMRAHKDSDFWMKNGVQQCENLMYRQGKSGDWKNWFTVAQSEQFDRQWAKAMAKSKLFKFC
nr:hypothetical protein BaRGS_007809 [Batillaria attramentaria]